MATLTPAPAIDPPAELPCHQCGYDLRMHPADGVCPECEASVAVSRERAKVPRRPAWRDADPRWRRRMVAGVWTLVLVPFWELMLRFRWTRSVPLPTFFDVQGAVTLDDSYLEMVWGYLTFCIGAVLLFAKERNRQAGRFDWTRRWGVIGSYCVALLGFAQYAFITALVIVGIAAMCQSMPRSQQPAVTDVFVWIGTTYIYYGPQSNRFGDSVLAAFSSLVMLLACAPLYTALRSTGSKAWSGLLLLPLAIASVLQIGYAALYAVNSIAFSSFWMYTRMFYFNARLLAGGFEQARSSSADREFVGEAIKWLTLLAIAVWLTIAQIAAAIHRRRIRRAEQAA